MTKARKREQQNKEGKKKKLNATEAVSLVPPHYTGLQAPTTVKTFVYSSAF